MEAVPVPDGGDEGGVLGALLLEVDGHHLLVQLYGRVPFCWAVK